MYIQTIIYGVAYDSGTGSLSSEAMHVVCYIGIQMINNKIVIVSAHSVLNTDKITKSI